jgi:hypothetical protein
LNSSIHRRLQQLEATLPPAPDPYADLSDEERLAKLQELAETIMRRRQALDSILSQPGAAQLSDAAVAGLCGEGVTAAMVHHHRHPPPPTPPTLEDAERAKFLRELVRRVAAKRALAEAAGGAAWPGRPPDDPPA